MVAQDECSIYFFISLDDKKNTNKKLFFLNHNKYIKRYVTYNIVLTSIKLKKKKNRFLFI